MKNEKTGIDERCAECKHYKPEGVILGWCLKHWRLNQKWDTRTEYDLWCQHWEGKPMTQHEEQLAKALQFEKEKDQMDYYSGKTKEPPYANQVETEGPEPGVQMGYQSPGQAADSLGAGTRKDWEVNPVPSLDHSDVVHAIIQELAVQAKELAQMDSECTKSMAAAAKSGDRMALAEVGAMLRAFEMIRVNVHGRIKELKAQIV